MGVGSIKFACPHCHRRCKVPLDLAGKRGRCPGCKRALEVPRPEEDQDLPDDEAADEAAGDEEKKPKLHWTIKVGLACILCLPLPGLIFSYVGLQKAKRANAHLQIAYLAVSLNAAWIVLNVIYMAVRL